MENKVIEFFVDCVPPTATHQQKKVAKVNGRLRFYEPDNLAAARDNLALWLKPYRPESPFTCGVALTVSWRFPRGRHKKYSWRTTRPDTDNLQKLLKDVMTGLGYWKDDALVAVEHVDKRWADRPGIYIKIEPLPLSWREP